MLKNKVIIITGASQGLGKSIAIKTARNGAIVVLIARRKKYLKEVADEIKIKGGIANYFPCDIKYAVEIEKTVAEIIKQYKKIDILINNAGIWTDDEIEKTKPEQAKLAFETNALGNITFIKSFLPYLKKQNNGHIINVISSAGTVESDNTSWMTYAATKWALTGYTKSLRESLKNTKIKVTGFFPGGFESNLYENASRPNPHNQPWMMKTEDVTDLVLFCITRPDDVVVDSLIVSKLVQ